MYSVFDHPAAPMDTDIKNGAWFDHPYPGLSYFPAFQGTPFTVRKTETFPSFPISSNQKLQDMTAFNTDCYTPSSTSSSNRAIPTSMQKTFMKNLLNEVMLVKGSLKARFHPEFGTDNFVRNGTTIAVPVVYQNLIGMSEYKNQSFEEIRLEDYIAFSMLNMRGNIDTSIVGPDTAKEPEREPFPQSQRIEFFSQPQLLNPLLFNTTQQKNRTFEETTSNMKGNPYTSTVDPGTAKEPERELFPQSKRIEILSQPQLLNPLLFNTTQQKNRTPEKTTSETKETAIFDESTSSLLQALMDNVKQCVDVNYLSEEAKRNCATLLHALADFTEKTLENLTVIVLEDMLRNIKQRKIVSSPATADKHTSTCTCSEQNSTRTENQDEKTHEKITVHVKKQSPKISNSKSEDDCSSNCQDSRAEKDTQPIGNKTKNLREMLEKFIKTNQKKTNSTFGKTFSSIPRSSRHSYSGSARSTEKVNRHRGSHRKSYPDEKYSSFREKATYDDSDNEEFVKRIDDSKRCTKKHDDEGLGVTINRAKYNRENYRRKKRSPKKVQFVVNDECCICESLGKVSIDDCDRKEGIITVKQMAPYCRGHVFETSKKVVVDEISENERRQVDKTVEASSANTAESSVAQNEYESQFSSDSSSI